MPTIAGYAKAWSENVVQLTVKGSGHFVPMDGPAQTLHMLINFFRNNYNYSTPIFDVDITSQPTITPTSPPKCTRKESDRILSMPGLDWSLPFKQYSGFLKGSDTRMLNDALSNYLNLDSVRSALNIPAAGSTWVADGGIIAVYNQTNPSAAPSFDYIINSPYYNASNFTILLYSGDVDTMCNWMGAEWFTTEYFTGSIGLPLPAREPWTYQIDPDNYPTLGGFARKYTKNIDVLTGSGHFVPLDRPMQALQMIYNWINRADYSTSFNITQPTTTPTPAMTTTPIVTQSTASAVSVSGSTPKPNTPGTPVAGDTTVATSSGTSPENILSSVQSAPPITEYTVEPTTSGVSNPIMIQSLMLFVALRILI